MAGILTLVNRIKMPPDLLTAVVAMYAEQPPDERVSLEARSIRLLEFLDRKSLKGPDLLLAIDFRLIALARLMESHDVRAWVMTGEPAGPSSVHADPIRAAAAEPVIETANQPTFDPDSFRARVLKSSTARGNA
jgi:hypothetical protein